jgi:hypothetical protein
MTARRGHKDDAAADTRMILFSGSRNTIHLPLRALGRAEANEGADLSAQDCGLSAQDCGGNGIGVCPSIIGAHPHNRRSSYWPFFRS